MVVMTTPLVDTIQLRLETPHSNARRTTVAETVIGPRGRGHPFSDSVRPVRFRGASTRSRVGRHPTAISAPRRRWGRRDSCGASCSPRASSERLSSTRSWPSSSLKHVRRRDPVSVAGCMVLTMSFFFFIVYDSLESPLFILMLAIGLMNRQRLEDDDRQSHLLGRATLLRTRRGHTQATSTCTDIKQLGRRIYVPVGEMTSSLEDGSVVHRGGGTAMRHDESLSSAADASCRAFGRVSQGSELLRRELRQGDVVVPRALSPSRHCVASHAGFGRAPSRPSMPAATTCSIRWPLSGSDAICRGQGPGSRQRPDRTCLLRIPA